MVGQKWATLVGNIVRNLFKKKCQHNLSTISWAVIHPWAVVHGWRILGLPYLGLLHSSKNLARPLVQTWLDDFVSERWNIQSDHPITLLTHFKTNTKSISIYKVLRCCVLLKNQNIEKVVQWARLSIDFYKRYALYILHL